MFAYSASMPSYHLMSRIALIGQDEFAVTVSAIPADRGVIVWLPIVPIRCLRVINKETNTTIVTGVSPAFLATEIPMDWRHAATHLAIASIPFLGALLAFGVFAQTASPP